MLDKPYKVGYIVRTRYGFPTRKDVIEKEVSSIVRLTESLSQWLWDNHREELPLIMLGHTELMTDEWWGAYLAWLQSDKGYIALCQMEEGVPGWRGVAVNSEGGEQYGIGN